jgi:hypothetical protein
MVWSLALNAEISSGGLSAFFDATDTVRIFEADGVTPVTLITATPEPASALLILPALLGLYGIMSKRKSALQGTR